MSWLQFAVASENLAFPADKQEGAIDAPSCPLVEFNYTNDHIDAGPPRHRTKPVRRGTRYLNGIGQILRCRFPPERCGWCAGEKRVTRQPSLTERRERPPALGCLLDEPAGFIRRGVTLK